MLLKSFFIRFENSTPNLELFHLLLWVSSLTLAIIQLPKRKWTPHLLSLFYFYFFYSSPSTPLFLLIDDFRCTFMNKTVSVWLLRIQSNGCLFLIRRIIVEWMLLICCRIHFCRTTLSLLSFFTGLRHIEIISREGSVYCLDCIHDNLLLDIKLFFWTFVEGFKGVEQIIDSIFSDVGNATNFSVSFSVGEEARGVTMRQNILKWELIVVDIFRGAWTLLRIVAHDFYLIIINIWKIDAKSIQMS